ncbi:MAG: IS256 family transposase [bacterium]|nr:IS256 family transposase [bacterium]
MAKRMTIEEARTEIWKAIEGRVIFSTKVLIETLLMLELTEQIQALPYERGKSRKGYRNGKYKRTLLTKYGPLLDLSVPRVRKGEIEFKVLEKYKRRAPDIDTSIGELFISGISTRKLENILEKLYGKRVSRQTVSDAQKSLDEEVEKYKTKQIEDTVEFLFLDGITQKVREIGIEGKVMLCAYGIYKDGRREILSFELVDVEDTDNWRGFLINLKSRGLLGKSLKLIITDGNLGLLKALREIYPFKKVQRCIAHKLRNVGAKLRKRNKKECMREASLIFGGESKREAINRFKQWKEKWQIEEERAVKCLEKDLFNCLHYYEFDKALWKSIRTTNILERAFREVRRRTRPMNIFPNSDSSVRIMYAITRLLNDNWTRAMV